MTRPSGISRLEQLQPVKTARLSPASQTEGVKVLVNPMHLDEIPVAMDRMGWKVSAQLMRRWFSTKPAWTMSEAMRRGHLNGGGFVDYKKLPISQVDDQNVKMKWLLNFESVVSVFEDFIENWQTVAAHGRLIELLKGAGWSFGKSTALGYGLKSAIDLEGHADVNYRPFGEYTDVLNDLYGAIFRGTLKIAVVGQTNFSRATNTNIFEIERMGIYLRDTYDFNASMLNDEVAGLGVWGRDRLLSKIEMLDYKTSSYAAIAVRYPGYVPVRNRDFVKWQLVNGAGGDFFVFSDVYWIKPRIKYVPI